MKLQIRRIKSRRDNKSIFYQRGSAALSRQITKETNGLVECDKEKAQSYIDVFYRTYPEVRAYVDYCKDRVLKPGWIETPYGRRRRFISVGEDSFLAAQQREGINFTIQSTVADTLNVALINFYWWRKINPGKADYRLLLPVHDAVLLECRPQCLEVVLKEVIPQCMTSGAVVPQWKPGCTTGDRPARKSFCLETDIEFGIRWGDKAKKVKAELLALGVPERLIDEKGK